MIEYDIGYNNINIKRGHPKMPCDYRYLIGRKGVEILNCLIIFTNIQNCFRFKTIFPIPMFINR